MRVREHVAFSRNAAKISYRDIYNPGALCAVLQEAEIASQLTVISSVDALFRLVLSEGEQRWF